MTRENFPALYDLLDEADQYPNDRGTIGFDMTNARLQSVLAECSEYLTVGAIVEEPRRGPHRDDMTSMRITVYMSLSRNEMDAYAPSSDLAGRPKPEDDKRARMVDAIDRLVDGTADMGAGLGPNNVADLASTARDDIMRLAGLTP